MIALDSWDVTDIDTSPSHQLKPKQNTSIVNHKYVIDVELVSQGKSHIINKSSQSKQSHTIDDRRQFSGME